MTVGIGMTGKERIFTLGGDTILGVSTTGATLNNEPVEVTDNDSNGWTTLLATPGVKSLEYPISGILKNLELINTWGNGGSQMFAITITYPDGSVLSFDGFMTNFTETGESNTSVTFDATFVSSGEVTFVAGT